jgi:predicted site-specific integrase-resolvase
MKLSVWAKKQGISYRTAWQYFKDGKLPVKATQLPSGTVIIEEFEDTRVISKIAAYARVSSSDQKKDLVTQLDRIIQFANANGHQVTHAVSEVGSGLNGKRPKLMKLLEDPTIDLIIVEHRDRFVRFGFEYIEASMKAQGRKIQVMDCRELEDDLVRDMTEVLTSFCARLYGKRAARRKAAIAIEAMNNNE